MSAPAAAAAMHDFQRAALETLLIREWHLFPCGQDKRPLTPRGHKDATVDLNVITRWWEENPTALVGVPTGPRSDVDVLDIDPRNGGMDWYNANRSRLPRTLTVRTRSGGLHLLFRHSPGLRCSAGAIAPGVDVRGDGGYVVNWAAHGCQVIDDSPIAAPGHFDLLAAAMAGRPRSAATSERPAVELAPPSWQDAVALLDALPNPADVDRDVYLSVMLSAVGCIQGLEAAGQKSGAEEIRKAACEWAMRWELHSGTDEYAKWDDDLSTRTNALAGWPSLLRHAQRLNPEWAAARGQSAAAAEFASVPVPPEPMTPGRKLRLLSVSAIETMPEMEYLVRGLVPERSFVVGYGPPKQGKTFVLLSLALHIAAGRDWCGRQVKQGGVVYIAGEGAGGLKLRILAARQHYGIPADIPFWVIPRAVNFGDRAGVKDLLAAIRDTVGDLPVRLVVVDTLSRAIAGMDESTAQDMGAFIAACDDLKEALGCTVMPVHHTGKDEGRGARGSSSLAGAVDASFIITRTKSDVADIVTLANEFQKDAEESAPLYFDMVKVDAAPGRGSLVPVLRTDGVEKVKALRRGAAAAFEVLSRMLAEAGADDVPDADWRAACIADPRVSTAETAKDRGTAFRRAYDTLLDVRRVETRAGRVGLPGRAAGLTCPPVRGGDLDAIMEPATRRQTADVATCRRRDRRQTATRP